MIREDKRKQLRKLREAGHGIRWIARQLRISRNAVREILDPSLRDRRKEKAKTKGGSAPQGSLLDPFKERIGELLEEVAILQEKKRSHDPGRLPSRAAGAASQKSKALPPLRDRSG